MRPKRRSRSKNAGGPFVTGLLLADEPGGARRRCKNKELKWRYTFHEVTAGRAGGLAGFELRAASIKARWKRLKSC